MLKKSALNVIFLLVTTGFLLAQSPSRIQKIYEKGDYPKARSLIIKSLEKDSVNAGARYFNSLLFMVDPFRSNTDSARWYINAAISDYGTADEKGMKALDKAGITEEILIDQKQEVSKRAFSESTAKSTVESMDEFLHNYPEANQTIRAIEIRDSLAYNDTKAINTWQAYQDYLNEYPDSRYYGESKDNYDLLLFEEKTMSNKLENFISFVKEFPESPYRPSVEHKILKRTTASHAWGDYVRFLKDYPESHLRKRIVDVLYYLDKADGHQKYDELLGLSPDTDSINSIKTLEWPMLFPVFSNKTYGFFSMSGDEIAAPQFSSIPSLYYCGGITSEWLQGRKDGNPEDVIVARNGDKILKGVTSFSNLGSGIVLVDFGSTRQVYHKSGFKLDEAGYDEAEVLLGTFIRTVRNGGEGLMSFMGEHILSNEFKSIEVTGEFILIGKGDKYAATNMARLNKMVREGKVALDFDFDDFDVVNDTLLLTFNGDKEALYDHNLEVLIPEGEHQIFTYGAAWYIRKEDGFQIFNRNSESLVNQTFPQLEVNNGWMAIKRKDDWLLISQHYKVLPMKDLDSIKLINESVAYIQKGDTLNLVFNNGKIEWLQPDEQVVVLRSGDQAMSNRAEYIRISSEDYHKVLSNEGNFLMSGRFDELAYLSDSLFSFTRKGKKGIVAVDGKEIIKPEYESIDERKGLISLLKGGLIGCYNPKTRVTIPPKYESLITAFGDYFVISKDQKGGLINKSNKVVIPIEYDEFMYWNDTSFWARDSSLWNLMSFESEILIPGVQQMELISQSGEEKFYKILKDQSYGVISNAQGAVIETGYNDIVNIGIPEQPFYFAEQHLQAAAFYVVTYYDKKGKPVKSQAYRPDEYDLIYCDR